MNRWQVLILVLAGLWALNWVLNGLAGPSMTHTPPEILEEARRREMPVHFAVAGLGAVAGGVGIYLTRTRGPRGTGRRE